MNQIEYTAIDVLSWGMVNWPIYTIPALENRAEAAGDTPYGKFLLEVVKARKSGELSNFQAFLMVHEWQRRAGIRK